jgi:hypothetical protein
MLFLKYSKETHETTDWTDLSTGLWIIEILPYWAIKLILLSLSIFITFMSFDYVKNVIFLDDWS